MPARRGSPNLIVAALTVGSMAYVLSPSVVIPALPAIQRSVHASTAGVAWVLTAYLLAASVLVAIVGRLGDLFGKRRVVIGGLALCAVGSVIAALADSLPLLLAGRVLQACASGMYALSYGIIRDEFPRERVTVGIGVMSATLGLGTAAGPIAGGVIAQYASVRFVFGLVAVLSALGAAAAHRFVPDSPPHVRARVDWTGGVLFAVGLAAPLLAISQGAAWGWGSARILGLLLGGIAVLVLFGCFELRLRHPLVDVRMLARRTSLAANGAGLFVGFGSTGSFLLFPLLAQQPRSGVGFGWGALAAGALLVPQGLAQLATGRLGGSLGHRHGNRLPLLLGCLLGAIPLAVVPLLDYSAWLFVVVSALAGVGSGLAWAAIPNLTLEGVPPDRTSVATSMNTIGAVAGSAIAAQLALAILGAHLIAGTSSFSQSGFDLAFLVCTAGYVCSAALAASAPAGRPAAAG